MFLGGPAAGPSSLLTGRGGYWKLDGNCNDLLGVSTGTDTNVSYVSAKINQGATSGGGSWRISVGSSLAIRPVAAITVAGWFKWAGFQTDARVLTDWHQSSVADRWILGYDYGTGVVVAVVANAGEASVVTPSFAAGLPGGVLVTGTWYHLAFTYDGSNVRVYRDGAQVSSAALSGTMNASASGVRFGQQLESGNPFNGTFDEIGIWSRALTGAEITTLYNGGAGLSYPF
jgi:hypothetical protein